MGKNKKKERERETQWVKDQEMINSINCIILQKNTEPKINRKKSFFLIMFNDLHFAILLLLQVKIQQGEGEGGGGRGMVKVQLQNDL